MSRAEPFVRHLDECELEGPGAGLAWWTLVSGDRTPSRELTLGVVEIAPGAQAAPPHRHPPSELYYVLEGEGVLEVEGREIPLRPGAAAHIPGGARHRALARGAAPLRILYVFPTDAFSDVEYSFEP